jgi:hypothetical protein
MRPRRSEELRYVAFEYDDSGARFACTPSSSTAWQKHRDPDAPATAADVERVGEVIFVEIAARYRFAAGATLLTVSERQYPPPGPEGPA